MKCSCLFLLLLAWVGASSPALVCAQISSPAFDPNCYFPRIGVPGEIDTIYGGHRFQQLGWGLINIGPSPDDPGGPGRLMMGGLPGGKNDTDFSIMQAGPSLDLHNLKITKQPGFRIVNPVLGHFRSKNYTDLLTQTKIFPPWGTDQYYPIIYWQSDDGSYDSTNYTILLPKERPFPTLVSFMPVYHAYMTSDTAEDVVYMYVPTWTDTTAGDSLMFTHFSGGADMYHPKGIVRADTEAFSELYRTAIQPGFSSCITGDFRGTGRKDLVAITTGNIFFYSNDRPFNIDKLSHDLRFDTLISATDDKRINTKDDGYGFWPVARAMHALHSTTQQCDDLLLDFDSLSETRNWSYNAQIKIFSGGPDFGSHQITIDSAAATIHQPAFIDSNSWKNFPNPGLGGNIDGDLTGTGEPVLGCAVDARDFGYYCFYVLGKSLDEKIDMYVGQVNGGDFFDTVTADGDRLQDVALSSPLYNVDPSRWQDMVGSLLILHGSNKIPVRLNRIIVRKQQPQLEGRLTVAPNPFRTHSVVTWESACSGMVGVRVTDLLGRTVFREDRRTTGDLESFSLDLPELPGGTYTLQLLQEPCVQTAKLTILR